MIHAVRSLMFPKMSFLKAKSSVLTVARTLSLIFQSFSAMRKMTSVMPIVHHATVVGHRRIINKTNTLRIVYTRGVFMLYRKRCKRKFVLLKRILLAVVLLIIGVTVFCEVHLSDFRPEYIRIQAEILSVNSVCDAVNNTLDKLNYSYSDIAKINCDKNGNVQSIETDSFKINRIKADITKAVQKEIAKVYDNEIEIPLGAFTNITILSNVGPCIPVSFNLTGSFSSEVISTFEQAGINQTIHHIKLLLTSKIMTTSLDYSGKITFTTDFEIAQSVIVGNIPSGYGSLFQTYKK